MDVAHWRSGHSAQTFCGRGNLHQQEDDTSSTPKERLGDFFFGLGEAGEFGDDWALVDQFGVRDVGECFIRFCFALLSS